MAERLAPKVASLLRPAYVAIGSNLGQPAERVLEAFDRLRDVSTIPVIRSRLYRTRPLGPQDQPDYVNAVAGMLTACGARELLDRLLNIEQTMGRKRGERWGPRVIDLDLIWMVGTPVDEPGLKVPHPAVSSRNFVLYPLLDVAPALKIPGLGYVRDRLQALGDDGISVLE